MVTGGVVGAMGSGAICVGIGVATVGVGGAVCAVVVAGLGSAVGGNAFSKVGETIGEIVYKVVR